MFSLEDRMERFTRINFNGEVKDEYYPEDHDGDIENYQ